MYVENRMHSAAAKANPYLVLAATVAAGVDGIINRLHCPAERVDAVQSAPLVRSLSDAQQSLQKRSYHQRCSPRRVCLLVSAVQELGEVDTLKNSSYESERNTLRYQYLDACSSTGFA